MITGLTSQAQLLGSLQSKLTDLRRSMNDAGNVVNWVIAQSAADLVGLGFTDTEAATIQEVCGNLAKLIGAANGGAQPPQMNYVTDAMQLIGPQ